MATTNWVNIKITESVRERARESEKTYSELIETGLQADRNKERHEELMNRLDELPEQVIRELRER